MSPLSEADREQMFTWYPEQFLIQETGTIMITFIPEKISNACGEKDAWQEKSYCEISG